MDFRFCVQDPTDPDTTYLYEEIVGAALGATSWRGLYAFATRSGVNQLIEDQAVDDFIAGGGQIDLLVGIDAITNRQTLERLQQLEAAHATFRPRVFWNETGALFHPKLSHFVYADGRETLICGSGNLTPNGLQHNFEAYSVISAAVGEHIDMAAMNDFLIRQAANIRAIDDAALERAARNIVRPIAGAVRPARSAPIVVPRPRKRIITPVTPRPASAGVVDRILISQVPAAGGRWAQVHFNGDVISNYFRVTDRGKQRVYLTHIDAAGLRSEEQEVRPVVYSQTNKNHKIEIAAAKGQAYPTGKPPLLLLRERQVRSFDYMLLMPGDAGYAQLNRLVTTMPSLGKGLKRVITSLAQLAAAWPACPLLVTNTEAEREI